MKQYKETQDGSFSINGMTIPNSTSNRHYNQMIQEVADAEAEIVLFDHAAAEAMELEALERAWRDNELKAVDILVRKAWKEPEEVQRLNTYADALREYPKQFPDYNRPVLGT